MLEHKRQECFPLGLSPDAAGVLADSWQGLTFFGGSRGV